MSEKLTFNKNGQWNLVKSREDLDSAMKKYKPLSGKEKQHAVHNGKWYTKNDGWKSTNGSATLADYSSKLPKFDADDRDPAHHGLPHIDEEIWGDNVGDPKLNSEEQRALYDPQSKEAMKIYDDHNKRSYGHDHKFSWTHGYTASEDTDDKGNSGVRVFYSDPYNRQFRHVGFFNVDTSKDLDKDKAGDAVKGDIHPEFKHREQDIKEALYAQSMHDKAKNDHKESFDEHNPHLKNVHPGELQGIHNDSLMNFLSTGKAMHVDPKTLEAYSSQEEEPTEDVMGVPMTRVKDKNNKKNLN